MSFHGNLPGENREDRRAGGDVSSVILCIIRCVRNDPVAYVCAWSQSRSLILPHHRRFAKVELQRWNRLLSADSDSDLTEKRDSAIAHTFRAGMLSYRADY